MNLLLETSNIVSQGLVFRNAPPPWVIWLVILPGIVGLTVFFYRMGRVGSPLIRGILAALRILVLLFVVALLFDPAMETQLIEHRPTVGVVLVDASASMDHKDDYAASPELASEIRKVAKLKAGDPMDQYSRMDLLKRVLGRADDGAPLLQKLASERRLRMFSFGERLQGIPGIDEVEPKERVTRLNWALETVLDEPEVKSVPIGGVVLLTDGKDTTNEAFTAALALAKKRRIKVHTIGIGDPKAMQDIELSSLIYPSVVLVDDTMTFEMKIRQRGFGGRQVEIVLLENGQPLHRQREVLLATEEDQPFRMLYRPLREGNHQWEVKVLPLPGEHTQDNNAKPVEVTVKRTKLKVLYVDTLPRWEYRKLKDFLARSGEAFVTHCFLLEADRGFRQESTANVPSLRRFPDTEEALFEYDVILFGDVDPERLGEFDPQRTKLILDLIKKFVDNGGGFCMIAGDRFAPLAYKDPPMGDILPVVVDPTLDGSQSDSIVGYKSKLTDLGRNHPIMQLEQDPERNLRIWEGHGDHLSLKEMYWYARVKKAKPGSAVLAVHPSARNSLGNYPLIVSGIYGEGPVLFIAFDETWRWYWWQGAVMHHRFWGNVVRYLARTRLFKGDKRFRLTSNRSTYQAGDRVTLTAYVLDRAYRPSERDDQLIVIEHPKASGKRDEQIRLPKVEPGRYEKSFFLSETGFYRAWIPPEEGISDDKISPISFVVKVSDEERREPFLNEPALQIIAKETGGRYGGLGNALGIIKEVSDGKVEIPRQRRYTHLRDAEGDWLKWLPIVFLSLLTIEWILRKRFRFL